MELSLMLSIVERRQSERYVTLCKSLGLPLTLTMLGRGTAMRAHLDLYGLEATQKAVVATVADEQNAHRLFREAKRQLYLDIPGNGIMLAIPIKSVGGGRTLAYLTDNKSLDAAPPPEGFDHELVMMILNEGYIDEVMDVAREAGAAGGTPRARARDRRKSSSASRWPTKKRCFSSWPKQLKRPTSCALSSAHTGRTPPRAPSSSPCRSHRWRVCACLKTNEPALKPGEMGEYSLQG